MHQISDSDIVEADLSVAGPSNADYVNFTEQPSEQRVHHAARPLSKVWQIQEPPVYL